MTPGDRCFDLHIDLVGGDIADRLALGDLVPDLYQPCRDGKFPGPRRPGGE